MLEDRFLKRLNKKARKRLRGWPVVTIAFYAALTKASSVCSAGQSARRDATAHIASAFRERT